MSASPEWVASGRVAHDPFLYWLPDMEAKWKEDPLGLKQRDEEMQCWLESLGKP